MVFLELHELLLQTSMTLSGHNSYDNTMKVKVNNSLEKVQIQQKLHTHCNNRAERGQWNVCNMLHVSVCVYLWHHCSDTVVLIWKLCVFLLSRLHGLWKHISCKGQIKHKPKPERIQFNLVGSLHVLCLTHTPELVLTCWDQNTSWAFGKYALKPTWSGPILSYKLVILATRLHCLFPDHFCKSL